MVLDHLYYHADDIGYYLCSHPFYPIHAYSGALGCQDPSTTASDVTVSECGLPHSRQVYPLCFFPSSLYSALKKDDITNRKLSNADLLGPHLCLVSGFDRFPA
jgi:hypothetical protein